MSATVSLPRPLKRDIARQIGQNLAARKQAGLPEPALDDFIAPLGDVANRLETHVEGQLVADAARAALVARVDVGDVHVDSWYRHIEGFLSVEARRRSGPNVEAASAVHKAACPDGLAYVDAYIIDENAYCRAMLTVLRAPEHQKTLEAIEFPMSWLDKLEGALTGSETAMAEMLKARDERRGHVGLGRDAEADWVELMIRLRRYMSMRADRRDTAKQNEGKALLQPLLDALQKEKTVAATRATRRSNAAAASEVHGALPVTNGSSTVAPASNA